MGKPLHVLIVEDSEDDALLTIRALKKGGYKLVYERVEDAEAMRKALREKTWDVILCDYRLPHFNGLAAIALLKDTGIDLPLIIVSGAIGEETAADCMRYGAHDYIMKNNLTRLVPAIERELKEAETKIQHKQAEEALKEGEERYRLSFENVTDIIYMIDTDLNFLSVSPSIEKILGYKPQNFIGRSASELRHILAPEAFEQAIANFSLLLKGETAPSTIYRCIAKDGTIKYLEAIGSPVMREGKAIGLISVARDITDRKRAEESLRESEERYRTIIENMEDGYHEVDIKGNFTFFNESMRKIMGYEREELLGMNNRQYADEENTRKVYQTYNRVYRTGESVKNFEWQIIRKDGDRRDLEVSISLIRDGEAHPTGFRGIVRDTTDRKQAEEDLRQAEERYRSIFENAQEGIYRSTPEGRIIMANPAMAKIFGYDSPEELMTGITDVARQLYVDPEERAKIRKSIEEQGFVNNYETQFYRKDGSIIWISMTMQAVRDEKGQILYYEGMDEDITNSERGYRTDEKGSGSDRSGHCRDR